MPQLSKSPTHSMVGLLVGCCLGVSKCCLGVGSFCMFSDKCVLPTLHASTAIKPCVPRGWSQAWPGLSAFPPSYSLSLPLMKHTECPSHVPVGRRTPMPRLERVHMMCSMHLPCLPPARPAEDKMGGPRLPSPPPARCAAVCVGVCFCVAGVSRDVAVFADMSPCPLLCFSVGF